MDFVDPDLMETFKCNPLASLPRSCGKAVTFMDPDIDEMYERTI
jgi:hypothetical protein